MLASHGPVVAGLELEAAVFAIEELEETAKLCLLLKGMKPTIMDDTQIKDLATHFKIEWD
jgi:ribulose-5-phosphate 4-epimerase/fuculose-1-phosphate aldolase